MEILLIIVIALITIMEIILLRGIVVSSAKAEGATVKEFLRDLWKDAKDTFIAGVGR